MQEFMLELFGNFARIIVFLHVMSASLLIGSLFAVRFVIKPLLAGIDDEEIRYKRTLSALDKYFLFILLLMIVLISASIMMNIGLGFEYASPIIYTLIHIKEAIWLFLAFNFGFMYWKFLGAKSAFKMGDYFEVGENITLIINCLITLNLILTLIAAYIGVVIRGF